jgi:dTDP-glucose pyrophosphorylase
MTLEEKFWRKALLQSGSTIRQAVQGLNYSSVKIVLVVDKEDVLQGTISDGDIRQGLLRGLDLNSSIDTVVHQTPLVVPTNIRNEMVVQLMRANRISQIPVVDEKQRVVGLHLWDEVATVSQRPNIMVIMAGGKGTRLMPLTENCPKPMVELAGKPMLEHIIDSGKLAGFSHFILAIHHLGHMIEDHFGDGERFDVRIDYLREQSPLGTAGALSLLDPRPEVPFVVTNGDVVTDIQYGDIVDFHNGHDASATMAVRVHEWQHPYGVVRTEGVNIIGFDEKPIARSHINAGVYVLSPNALAELEADVSCDMPTLFERLQEKSERIVAYPMHEPWLDVGRPADLDKANEKYNDREGAGE